MYDPLALRPAIQMSQESRSLVVKGLDMTGFVAHDESFQLPLSCMIKSRCNLRVGTGISDDPWPKNDGADQDPGNVFASSTQIGQQCRAFKKDRDFELGVFF